MTNDGDIDENDEDVVDVDVGGEDSAVDNATGDDEGADHVCGKVCTKRILPGSPRSDSVVYVSDDD